jgi:hypothetical protein
LQSIPSAHFDRLILCPMIFVEDLWFPDAPLPQLHPARDVAEAYAA